MPAQPPTPHRQPWVNFCPLPAWDRGHASSCSFGVLPVAGRNIAFAGVLPACACLPSAGYACPLLVYLEPVTYPHYARHFDCYWVELSGWPCTYLTLLPPLCLTMCWALQFLFWDGTGRMDMALPACLPYPHGTQAGRPAHTLAPFCTPANYIQQLPTPFPLPPCTTCGLTWVGSGWCPGGYYRCGACLPRWSGSPALPWVGRDKFGVQGPSLPGGCLPCCCANSLPLAHSLGHLENSGTPELATRLPYCLPGMPVPCAWAFTCLYRPNTYMNYPTYTHLPACHLGVSAIVEHAVCKHHTCLHGLGEHGGRRLLCLTCLAQVENLPPVCRARHFAGPVMPSGGHGGNMPDLNLDWKELFLCCCATFQVGRQGGGVGGRACIPTQECLPCHATPTTIPAHLNLLGGVGEGRHPTIPSPHNTAPCHAMPSPSPAQLPHLQQQEGRAFIFACVPGWATTGGELEWRWEPGHVWGLGHPAHPFGEYLPRWNACHHWENPTFLPPTPLNIIYVILVCPHHACPPLMPACHAQPYHPLLLLALPRWCWYYCGDRDRTGVPVPACLPCPACLVFAGVGTVGGTDTCLPGRG